MAKNVYRIRKEGTKWAVVKGHTSTSSSVIVEDYVLYINPSFMECYFYLKARQENLIIDLP